MAKQVDAKTLKSWLSDGRELALIDVREAGQFGEAHLFFAVPLPYSRFEVALAALLPNPAVRLVLCDGATALPSGQLAVPRRSATATSTSSPAASKAGSVPATRSMRASTCRARPSASSSSTRGTRRASRPQAVETMRKAGENFVIVDGRPLTEYRRMNIPGGICCPNGELVLRIRDIAPDPKTKIVVNCAGRTRSIIGAQTLIDFGVPNPVVALENGTQGWFLAGLAARARRGPALPRAACGGQCCGPRGAGAQARRGPRRRVRCAGSRSRLARRRFAHDLPPRRAHARGVCRARRAGLRARARRPADPGDGPVGGRQGRAARADGRGGRAGAGRGGMAAPARTRGLCARGRDRRGVGAGLAAAADAFAKASDFEADGRP